MGVIFLGVRVILCDALAQPPFGVSPLPLQKLADAPLPSEADDYSPEVEVGKRGGRQREGGRGAKT
jgi:hypothetical protein